MKPLAGVPRFHLFKHFDVISLVSKRIDNEKLSSSLANMVNNNDDDKSNVLCKLTGAYGPYKQLSITCKFIKN